MSCLYSSPEVDSLEVTSLEVTSPEVTSPEVTSLEVISLGLSSSSSPDPIRHASRATRSPCSSIPHRFCRTSPSTRRVPQQSSGCRWPHQSFRLPKQAQVSSVAFQAQYQALALRTLASTRSIYGASNPGPML